AQATSGSRMRMRFMLIDFKKFESYKGTSPAALARDTVMFASAYVVLDWTSYLYPLGPFNITPWNPAPALSIIWMMLGGLRYAPLIYGTIFVSDVIIRHAPGGIVFSAITSLVLASGYAAMAAALSHFLKSDYRLSDTRQVWIFVA